MQKIQLVTYFPESLKKYGQEVEISDFNNLKSLDNYDINIFDLSNEAIWVNESNIADKPQTRIWLSSDFESIKTMVDNSKKAYILFCLPPNVKFKCKDYSDISYHELKNNLSIFKKILEQIIPLNDVNIVYENTFTEIDKNLVEASFYFTNDNYDKITFSKDSEKVTSIEFEKIIISSLQIINAENIDLLFGYLELIGLSNNQTNIPEWVYKYNFNDDELQNNKIQQAKEQIKIQKEIIEQANQKLQENLYFKSILYTNSDELVGVVFEIIENIFDVSLHDFNDEKKEDFLFKKDGTTYIGEIKGVTSNVKYEHISQLEVHFSKYLDKLQEEGSEEKIKKILIMNYERNRDVVKRNEINQMQIDLAIKNETLIIDTNTLLKIYEKILNGTFTKEQVTKYLTHNSGMIDIDKI